MAIVKVLPLPPGVEIRLLVLVVSAGAPLLPRKLMKIGDGAYVFSLVLTSRLLAIVLVLTWLAVIGPVLDYPVSLRPERGALVLGKSFLLPLNLGMAVRRLYPAVTDRVENRLMAIAGFVLTGCALALMILHWDILLVARWFGVPTLGSLIAISLAIGHCSAVLLRITVPRSRLPVGRAISGSPCWWRRRFPARARRSSLRSIF